MIYVVMVLDRHDDPKAHLCSTPGLALLRAEREALRLGRGDQANVDVKSPPAEGWMWHAEIGHEGDFVWVEAQEVDADAA